MEWGLQKNLLGLDAVLQPGPVSSVMPVLLVVKEDMKHYAVVPGVLVVAVALPVALPYVYLYVTPDKVSLFRDEQGVSEVRPHAGSWTSRVKDL